MLNLLFSSPLRPRFLPPTRPRLLSSVYNLLSLLPTPTARPLAPVFPPTTSHTPILTITLLSLCAPPGTSPLPTPSERPVHRTMPLRASKRGQTMIHRRLLCFKKKIGGKRA
jgi:hypothetical protein